MILWKMLFVLKEEIFTMELRKRINKPTKKTQFKKIIGKLKRINSMSKKIKILNKFKKVANISLKIRTTQKIIKTKKMKNMFEY